jgi:hypothetical protein
MSHISGDYTYQFVRLEPFYNNSSKTGMSALVVGMNCQFSGVDEQSNPVTESSYVDGTTGFIAWTDPIPDYPVSGETQASGYAICLTPEYVKDNISGLANEYASGLCWCHQLSGQINSRIESPIRDTDFPYPSGDPVFPPVDPHDM